MGYVTAWKGEMRIIGILEMLSKVLFVNQGAYHLWNMKESQNDNYIVVVGDIT